MLLIFYHQPLEPIGPGLSGSSVLRGPGGYPSSGGAASVSPALLRSSQTASETVVSNARTPIARPTAVPLYALCWRRWVLNRANRLHNTFSVRLVLFRPNRPHMLGLPPPLGYFFYQSYCSHALGALGYLIFLVVFLRGRV